MSAEVGWNSYRKHELNGIVSDTYLEFLFSPKVCDATKMIVEIHDASDDTTGQYPFVSFRLVEDGMHQTHFSDVEIETIMANFKKKRTIKFGPGDDYVLDPKWLREQLVIWKTKMTRQS